MPHLGLLQESTKASQEAKEAKEAKLAMLLESSSDAEKHRMARGEDEPVSPRKSGLGRHIGRRGGPMSLPPAACRLRQAGLSMRC